MFKRGEVYIVDLPEDKNKRIQGGKRPIVILSNDRANEHSDVIQYAPLTGQLKRLDLPVHVLVNDRILEKDSVVLLEQIGNLDKNDLAKRTIAKRGRLSEDSMNRISIGMAAQLGINISVLYFMINSNHNKEIIR